MECNRDEALRAKEIAERKFTEKNISGAKKFALKAKTLFPGLEGLPQMLATLDVHQAAENKIDGEADWYGILAVHPSADDETVKKQYRKLALMLHPDKNKSVGADGAFKLISEAWTLLSDKTKRIAYDQRRSFRTSQHKVPSATAGCSYPAAPGANGFCNVGKKDSISRAQKTASTVGTAPVPPCPPPPKPNTFWTVCNKCKMQYEYVRMYLNHNLLCPHCHEPFLAVETAPPSSNGSKLPTPWPSSQKRAKTSQGPSETQQAYDKARKEREEAEAAARGQEALRRKQSGSKKMASSSPAGPNPDPKGEKPPSKKRKKADGVGAHAPKQTASASGGVGIGSMPGVKQGDCEKDWPSRFPVNNKPNTTRELSSLEVKNMLIEKAKREIRKKLTEWRTAPAGASAEKENAKQEIPNKEKATKTAAAKVKSSATVNGDRTFQKKGVLSENGKNKLLHKVSVETSRVEPDTESIEPTSIIVPDPDFHDFDKDRNERSFGDNQVWAAYDDDDGMPRYYAMIHRVLSLKPFKLRLSWLNSKTNSEFGPLNWCGSGFYKTSGDFWIGKHEVNNSLNSFSHRVRWWTKGARGVIQVYPQKGDVWALYRNWSPDWNELTPDEVIHKYDMVEVLEDYNEEKGVSVTPLVKVTGFKTVFHRHLDPKEIKTIPRNEMFRFSHQVPSYVLTGSEAQNAPMGCRELDPAATPLELLQVITEAKEKIPETDNEQVMKDCMKEEVAEIAEEEKVAEATNKVVAENSGKQVKMEAGDSNSKRKEAEEKKSGKGSKRVKKESNEAKEKSAENDNEQIMKECLKEVVAEIAEEEKVVEVTNKDVAENSRKKVKKEAGDNNLKRKGADGKKSGKGSKRVKSESNEVEMAYKSNE